MDRMDKLRLQKLHSRLLQDIGVSDVLPILLQDGVLSSEDYEDIKSCCTRTKQTETLLFLLPKRGKRAYSCFCQALENSYPWLLTELKNLQITEEEEKKLAADKMYQPLTNEMVDMLRQNVQLVRRWHVLAHSLGMSAQRTQIQVQANLYMWDMEQCVLQLLEQWKSLKGNSATLGTLLESLRKEQFNDIADKLEEEFLQ
ncbi:death domain-containing protein CRADD-like [Limulus polyphemus]|uniref:Death domain-containing protein CRADD-like n=1 Tax=Limulus polyphemus TaxID=6850 RepID=A0ABM1B8J1_LIMPO|nr:death domain-containing protein CRADD-like [Limulus polyphemus]